jgi:hypothetical protein
MNHCAITGCTKPTYQHLAMQSDLDNYLKTIVEEVFMAGLGVAGADDIVPEDKDTAILNTQAHYTAKAIAAIKQALADAGYRQVTKDTADFYTLATVVTHTADFSKGELSKMMSGRQWYDRFVKEMGDDARYCLGCSCDAMEAAKKATGLE